jgi:antitoxin MazE
MGIPFILNLQSCNIGMRAGDYLERKIVKVGNSLGVIIPSTYLEELGLSYQDTVELDYNKDLKAITITKEKTILSEDYLEKVVKSIVDNYLKEKGLQ